MRAPRAAGAQGPGGRPLPAAASALAGESGKDVRHVSVPGAAHRALLVALSRRGRATPPPRSRPGCSPASRSGLGASAVRRSRTASSRAFVPTRQIAAAPAARACGATRAIPNYFFEWLHWFSLRRASPWAARSSGWLLGPRRHVRVPALGQRHSVHRGAGAAHPRRGLPPLSGGDLACCFPGFRRSIR